MMKKVWIRICCLTVLLNLLFHSVALASDTISYPTYTIDADFNEAESPVAFIPSSQVYGFEDPVDMEVYRDTVYVLDAKKGAITILNKELAVEKVIDTFHANGKEEHFSNPNGITLSPMGDIYIADTGNARIVCLNGDGSFKAEFKQPEISVLGKTYVYKPVKIGVDLAQRMYVVATGINRGLIQLNAEGKFMSFLGAPRVTYDIFTIMWKRILTKEQAKYLEKFVPTEFSNLRVDAEGFIYTATKANDTRKLYTEIKTGNVSIKAVQKLNASGIDVLRRYGNVPVVGDVNFEVPPESDGSGKAQATASTIYNPSTFEDIAIDGTGTYYCIDSRRGRVFVYDMDGNLLYAFGTSGSQSGCFVNPVAVDILDNRLLVLDKSLSRITVFDKTEYGETLHGASKYYSDGEYLQSLEMWEKVGRYNANLSLAYIGMGKSYYFLKDYKNAVYYLKLADEKYYCSKAYEKYRLAGMIRFFKPAAAILMIGLLLFLIIKCMKAFYSHRRGGGPYGSLHAK